ncbi:MAG: OsmC family peroxiredoxin, partial [Gluconacetobacter diazotrophicus]|nr:OsmC family peroxiredoxin [Gluconacetobacter diazotrophicus]
MAINKTAQASWEGGLKDGRGRISTESGVLDEAPYGFNTRFEGQKGTNPEELIAAAHSGCFTMALSKALGDEGYKPTRLHAKAVVTLEQQGEGFSVTRSALTLQA